jgi:hypothetical protein
LARKFVTSRELTLIKNINKELIQKFTGEEVTYYAISEEHTVAHRLYQESINKVWFSPVKINARVEYDNPGVESTNFTLDSQFTLGVFFLTDELIERNLKPKEGDFIEYGQIVYEITAVTQPQLVYGQINNKIMTKCMCVPSREGQMQVNSDSTQFVDNTHPRDSSTCGS